MKKKIAEHISKALPAVFSNIGKTLKNNFDANGQEILQDATGTAAIITKLFAQPAIDSYFQNLTEEKLKDHGLNVYIKAGFMQATESLEEIKDSLDKELAAESVLNFLNDELAKQGFGTENILLIFKPKYHPAIAAIKRHYENVLRQLGTPPLAIKNFTRHFNEHIEEKVRDEFGDYYVEHLQETEEFRLNDAETDFLWDMSELGHIGFKESENLQYEQTYACWKKVSEFKAEDNHEPNNIEEQEKDLQAINELIEQYFSQDTKGSLDKILFIIADFGKGKSVFLRHYTSELAKQYIETQEGLFPVYFNLRNFSTYSSEPKLGVISDYLEVEYAIKIDSEHFKKNQYIFLIDSLDESGELNKASIDKVIASVKKVQSMDTETCRTNRLVISTRPFDEGLEAHLNAHKPYVVTNKEKRDIPYFISIYGFKKQQFNHWLINTLKDYPELDTIQTTGFAKNIIENIKQGEATDIHQLLLDNNTLSTSELRRPIFAYMIFQLIINNIDFSAVGKIGVYLSFLNLLTKDAKHIHDTSYSVNLNQEFEFRNLLHSIASLWMHKRQQGQQGALNKADVCRVLDGENKKETDIKVLERYADDGVIEIQFLSHSYFGENDNVLHFQHQSFAEILLAEYYLKVFIKYALDEEFDVEEARTKLILGEPTAQTIQFFTEMLKLLIETATDENSQQVLEKRKLLFPLMASLATKKNNKLFCNAIYYEWFKQYPCKENEANYPPKLLVHWCIDQDKIDKIIRLAREILESKTNYILTQAETKTALYDNELLVVQDKLSNFAPDIDRWLALLVGNTLYNHVEEERFFNWNIKNFEHLFDLIRNWNYNYNEPAPKWGVGLFMGINMKSNKEVVSLNYCNLAFINFSHSYFYKLSFMFSYIGDGRYSNLQSAHEFDLAFTHIGQNIQTPIHLARLLNVRISPWGNAGAENTYISKEGWLFNSEYIYPLKDLFIYGLKNGLFTVKDTHSWFEFETKETEEEFFKKIGDLTEYQQLEIELQNDEGIIKIKAIK